MAYNYITKDDGIFDEALVQNMLTAPLEKQVNYLNNGKSFTLTDITVSGYKAHDRSGGFNRGTFDNEKKVYTITQDRDVEFFVDAMDVDETNKDLSVANISKKFITTQAAPEVDAYRFQQLAAFAATNNNTEAAALTSATVYSALKKAILPLRKYGAPNLLGYVSSEVMDMLERSEEFVRNINSEKLGVTALESRVTSLDGVQLIEVWDTDRFNTEHNFTEGYVPTGSDINFMIVAVPATIAIVRHRAIFLFAPGQHTRGDGYLYQNRLYHDIILPEKQVDAVYAHTAPVGTGG